MEAIRVEMPRMITIAEAQRLTGMSYQFIRSLILQGKITYVMTGRKYLINEVKLCEYLNRGEQEQMA